MTLHMIIESIRPGISLATHFALVLLNIGMTYLVLQQIGLRFEGLSALDAQKFLLLYVMPQMLP